MWVPDEAAEGMAKVKLSFPAWKEGDVVPAMTQFRIRKAAAKSSDNSSVLSRRT